MEYMNNHIITIIKERREHIKPSKIHNNLNGLEIIYFNIAEQPKQLRKSINVATSSVYISNNCNNLIGLEKYISNKLNSLEKYTYSKKPAQNNRQMVHMPNLKSWKWGLKIFDGAPTFPTYVMYGISNHSNTA